MVIDIAQIVYTPETLKKFDNFNERFAFVMAGKDARIYDRSEDAFYTESAFRLYTAPERLMPEEKPGKNAIDIEDTLPVGDHWLMWEKRSLYLGLVMLPEGRLSNGRPYTGRGLNQWRGFTAKNNTGDANKGQEGLKVILKHVLDVFHGGNVATYNWEINYWAHMIQKPWEKPQANIVRFEAEGGTGKDIIAQHLLKDGIVGEKHAVSLSGIDQLTGKHNKLLGSAVLLIGNEIAWGGDRKSRDKLWAETGTHSRTIEPKGIDSYQAPNFSRYLLHSNSDRPVPIDDGDRRWLVLKTTPLPFHRDEEQKRVYYKTLAEHAMNPDVVQAFYQLLKGRDITDFDCYHAPMTESKKELQGKNLDGRKQWLLDLAIGGCFRRANGTYEYLNEDCETHVDANILHEAVKEPFMKYGMGSASSGEVGKFLSQKTGTGMLAERTRVRECGRRVYKYTFPSVDRFRLIVSELLNVELPPLSMEKNMQGPDDERERAEGEVWSQLHSEEKDHQQSIRDLRQKESDGVSFNRGAWVFLIEDREKLAIRRKELEAKQKDTAVSVLGMKRVA
jgi:hypothetical protein